MLAVIPARGGSKGVPGKNIKELNGRPLIAYTIEAAVQAAGIDRVVVTTYDKKIAEVAVQYGAEVPFLRQASLAGDSSLAIDVYLDAIERLGSEYKEEPFMVLLPTTPFRTAQHIEEAILAFHKSHMKTLVSVTQAETPASWYMGISEEGILRPRNYAASGLICKNRQMNEVDFIPNGAIYILDYWLLKNKRTYYCDKTIPYIMSKESSVDIDTMEDFEYAEFLIKKNNKDEN